MACYYYEFTAGAGGADIEITTCGGSPFDLPITIGANSTYNSPCIEEVVLAVTYKVITGSISSYTQGVG